MNKDERLFKYAQYRIQQNFNETWYNVFQQMATVMVPGILLLMYITKVLQFYYSETFSQDISYIYSEDNWQKPSEDLHYSFPLITQGIASGEIKKDFSNMFVFVTENKEAMQ